MGKSFDPNAFIEKVKQTIDSNRLLEHGDAVLAGVSGGPDSMCLLHVLLALSLERSYVVEVAHVNHSLRGASSVADQEFVESRCKEWGVPVHTTTVDVSAYAKYHSMGTEEAARYLRYEYFQECTKGRGMKVAVAHHQQDQVETVLLNLIRGCGLDGMRGMEYGSGTVIRPLLDCSKEEIEAYLSFYRIPYCIDNTNQESFVNRNRVRLELLPFFQRIFGHNVSPSILKTSRLCLRDAAYLDGVAKQAYLAILDNGALPCDALDGLNPAISSRVIRCLYEAVKGDKKNLTLPQTEAMLRIAAKKREGASVHLPGGLRAVIIHRNLHILEQAVYNTAALNRAAEKETRNSVLIPLVIPAMRAEEEIKMNICTKLIENPDEVDYNAMAWCFPYEKAKGCVWRYRKEGDWIRPNRNSGKKTLKRFFIDGKVPSDHRDRLLLLAKGSEVLWIPDMQGHHPERPSAQKSNPGGLPGTEMTEYVHIRLEHRS